MITKAKADRYFDHHLPPVALAASFLRLAKGVLRDLADPYQPERHYMRGPGPKWRAKHLADDATI